MPNRNLLNACASWLEGSARAADTTCGLIKETFEITDMFARDLAAAINALQDIHALTDMVGCWYSVDGHEKVGTDAKAGPDPGYFEVGVWPEGYDEDGTPESPDLPKLIHAYWHNYTAEEIRQQAVGARDIAARALTVLGMLPAPASASPSEARTAPPVTIHIAGHVLPNTNPVAWVLDGVYSTEGCAHLAAMDIPGGFVEPHQLDKPITDADRTWEPHFVGDRPSVDDPKPGF